MLRDTEQRRRECRLAQAGFAVCNSCGDLLVFKKRVVLIDERADEQRRVARVFNAHLAHHLTNDNFDVLIVDINTLHT